MTTQYHAQYFANEIIKHTAFNSVERLSRSLFDSCVDLNPHQIEATLFALRSPISKGVILADEVGLGKTIEAGVLLCQLWAEKKRNLIVICPASLRKQWQIELEEKFNLPSFVLDARSYHAQIKQANMNPFHLKDFIVICSYQFASRFKEKLRSVPWHLSVIDEAHKLRNVYRPSNKTGQALKWALEDTKKVLLTATPLQNSLLELYGLSLMIDEHIFGDISSFRSNYTNTKGDIADLKARMSSFCKRTLRSDVLEYVPYTQRKLMTEPFIPTNDEQALYKAISKFLEQQESYAIPSGQKHLTTLILRKLLASSSYAVAGTLQTMRNRLNLILDGLPPDDEQFLTDLIENDDLQDDFFEETEEQDISFEKSEYDKEKLKSEISELDTYIAMAQAIQTDTKSFALLTALKTGFASIAQMGANRKALIFTESRRTQEYLKRFLDNHGYSGKITLFNGTNTDSESKAIYDSWVSENSMNGRATGSKAVDMRSALVEHFKNHSDIMIATEAAAEGINLQFCSLVINYDLPWNPQRVEQRIGRCHRYGQKHDVVVLNFINKRNEADMRVHQLLEEKFSLFTGVFGASDDVLGSIESGVDFEKRIYQIYQTCRTNADIEKAFKQLQIELEESIKVRMNDTRKMLFENFDEDVHARMRMRLHDTKEQLDKISTLFWRTSKVILNDYAQFNDDDLSFDLNKLPFFGVPRGHYSLVSKHKENIVGKFLYRLSSPLGEYVIDRALSQNLPLAHLSFDISNHPTKISMIQDLKGKSGWLSLSKIVIDSFENHEELVFSAIIDNGTELDQEVSPKLFQCHAHITPITHIPVQDKQHLDAQKNRIHNSTIHKLHEYNNQFFKEEYAKIDKWADDMVSSLEKELKDTKEQIKAINRQMRMTETLEQQAELQKKDADLRKKNPYPKA